MIADARLALLLRRQHLIARSEALRGRLLREVQPWQGPLVVADRMLWVGRWLHAQRHWPIGAAAVVVVLRPRRAARWLRRAWWLWRWSRRLRPWMGALAGVLAPAGPRAPVPPHR